MKLQVTSLTFCNVVNFNTIKNGVNGRTFQFQSFISWRGMENGDTIMAEVSKPDNSHDSVFTFDGFELSFCRGKSEIYYLLLQQTAKATRIEKRYKLGDYKCKSTVFTLRVFIENSNTMMPCVCVCFNSGIWFELRRRIWGIRSSCKDRIAPSGSTPSH